MKKLVSSADTINVQRHGLARKVINVVDLPSRMICVTLL